MKRNIGCPCGKTFSVETSEEIDLDMYPEQIERITDGSFMNFVCPGCGKIHKPEYPVILSWPSKKATIEFLPELDRGEFYRRKKDPPGAETVIGYPELSDRISIIRDGLEPAALESIKYYILLKAEENYPDAEINIRYQGKGPEAIEFHLHGIRDDEVAVTRVPLSLYDKTLADFAKHPKGELFVSLRTRSYLSVQNMLRPDALK
ncbi:hypothetical protein AGMMS50293_19060 [Spirochaetia bacterium]|nr:hypothetical protein AGMMS50293_19060 [Spirochaetia bacterium]